VRSRSANTGVGISVDDDDDNVVVGWVIIGEFCMTGEVRVAVLYMLGLEELTVEVGVRVVRSV
jgi:hypothetical protein